MFSLARPVPGPFPKEQIRSCGDVLRHMANFGTSPEFERYLAEHPQRPGRAIAAGRVLLSGKVEEIPDTLEDKEYVAPAQGLTTVRSVLGVPLLRGQSVEGALILLKREPGRFPTRQIELVKTFADQAVIAIENVRLFDEVQAKTRDLEESLQQQTATADVLKVISRSAFDLQAVLHTLVEFGRQVVRRRRGAYHPRGRRRPVSRRIVWVLRRVHDRNPPASGFAGAGDGQRARAARRQSHSDSRHRGRPRIRPQRTREDGRVSHLPRHSHVAERRSNRRHFVAPHQAPRVQRQADRARPDLRRPGRHRNRKRAPVRRGAGEDEGP